MIHAARTSPVRPTVTPSGHVIPLEKMQRGASTRLFGAIVGLGLAACGAKVSALQDAGTSGPDGSSLEAGDAPIGQDASPIDAPGDGAGDSSLFATDASDASDALDASHDADADAWMVVPIQ